VRMNSRSLSPSAALVILSCCICLSAQDKKDANAQSKFTARTQLVQIPALVTDKSGTHIAGLKKEDFVVLENGSERQIATFEEIASDPSRLILPRDANTFNNSVGGGIPHRVTIIVLDLLNTPFADQAYLRNELLKYLSQSLDRREPTGLITLDRNGIHLIHDFTSDPLVLMAALHAVRGDASKFVDGPEEMEAITGSASPEGSAGNSDTSGGSGGKGGSSAGLSNQVQQEVNRMQSMMEDAALNFQSFQQRLAIIYTLQGLQAVAQGTSGFSGRKSVIWASGGFPFSVSDNTMQLAPAGRDSLTDVLPLYERTWQLLNDAQIALYPIDVKGLQSNMPSASVGKINRSGRPSNYIRSATWRQIDTQSTFQVFAAATGGRAYYNSNDLVKGFRDAVRDSSEYYLLSYYLESGDTKPGWRKLTVKVKRDHVSVRARSGFYVASPSSAAQASESEDIAAALRSPWDYTSLPLVGRWETTEPSQEQGKKRVHYVVRLAPNAGIVDTGDKNHIALDLVVSARRVDGQQGAPPVQKKIDLHATPEQEAEVLEKGLNLKGVVELGPGDYNVRMVVRDNLSGRVGSVSAPLKVE
jgi:VWFA-related protein